MDLSVVIVSTNQSHFIAPCLTALRQEIGSLEFEVLLVDNACEDDTAAVTQRIYPEAMIVPIPRSGFPRANNQAIKRSRGRHVLLLNPDTEVRPGALAALVRYLDEHPQVGAVGAKLVNPDGTLQHSCRSFPTLRSVIFRGLPLCPRPVRERMLRDHLAIDWDHTEARPVDWVLGACLGVRRPIIEQVGMMDEGYFLYYEDIDWCYRIWKAGWEVHYVPESVVMHHYQRLSAHRALNRMTVIHTRSMLRYFLKHRLGRR